MQARAHLGVWLQEFGVLDAVETSVDCKPHRLRRTTVRGRQPSQPVRGLDRDYQFVECVRRIVRQVAQRGAPGRHDLDVVRAFGDQPADRGANRIGSVRLSVAEVEVPEVGRNGATGQQHSRTADVAASDGFAHHKGHAIAPAVVPHRRHAAGQVPAQVGDRDQGQHLVRILVHLLVGAFVAGERQVTVGIDEAGQERCVREVLGAGDVRIVRLEPGERLHPDDPSIFRHDDTILDGGVGRRGEHSRGTQRATRFDQRGLALHSGHDDTADAVPLQDEENDQQRDRRGGRAGNGFAPQRSIRAGLGERGGDRYLRDFLIRVQHYYQRPQDVVPRPQRGRVGTTRDAASRGRRTGCVAGCRGGCRGRRCGGGKRPVLQSRPAAALVPRRRATRTTAANTTKRDGCMTTYPLRIGSLEVRVCNRSEIAPSFGLLAQKIRRPVVQYSPCLCVVGMGGACREQECGFMRVGVDGRKIPQAKERGPLRSLDHVVELEMEGSFFRTILEMSPTLDIGELREIRAHADELDLYLETGLGLLGSARQRQSKRSPGSTGDSRRG